MREDVLARRQAEQRVQHARVGDVCLRRAHLSLADVLVPWLELPDHEDGRQEIEIAPHRRVGDAERPAELGSIPDLSVPMGEHRPEAAQGEWRDGASEVGYVAREERPDEAVAPAPARGSGPGEVREGEAAAQPQPLQVFDLAQAEPVQLVECDATGEGLGGLSQEVGRRASQDEEPGRGARPIRKDAQQREDLGKSVDLVEDHEPAQGPQLEAGIGQAGQIGRVLEIEPCGRTAAGCHDLPREGRLPHLPGAKERDDRELPQEQANPAQVIISGNLHALKSERSVHGFQYADAGIAGRGLPFGSSGRAGTRRRCRV